MHNVSTEFASRVSRRLNQFVDSHEISRIGRIQAVSAAISIVAVTSFFSDLKDIGRDASDMQGEGEIDWANPDKTCEPMDNFFVSNPITLLGGLILIGTAQAYVQKKN